LQVERQQCQKYEHFRPEQRSSLILIVDDDKSMRILHQAMKEGYQVAEARMEVSSCLRAPDIVLLDAMMPVMDASLVAPNCKSSLKARCHPVREHAHRLSLGLTIKHRLIALSRWGRRLCYQAHPLGGAASARASSPNTNVIKSS